MADCTILARGWAKTVQPLHCGDDDALETIHRIERAVVHPKDASVDGVGPAADQPDD